MLLLLTVLVHILAKDMYPTTHLATVLNSTIKVIMRIALALDNL